MALRAATTFYFVGGTSGAYSTSTNWTITGGGAPDASDYPGWDNSEAANVDGDSVIFQQNPTNALVGGDYSAKGDLASLRITSLYAKAFATVAVPLKVDMQAAGACYLDCTNALTPSLMGGGARGLVNVQVVGKKSGQTLTLSGLIAGLTLRKANCAIAASSTISDWLTITYLSYRAQDVALTIGATVTLPALVWCAGGQIICGSALTGLLMTAGLGGQWAQAGAITEVEHDDGTLLWTSGDIASYVGYGGSLDASASVYAATLVDATIYTGCRINLNNGLNNRAVTWPVDMQGGDLEVSPGATLAVA